MASKVGGKKRKSSDDENLDLTAKCRSCDKMAPMCRLSQCSRNRQHYACVDCLRITAEEIVFEGADNYNHETKGINCYRNKCTGVFPYGDVKIHLIPEMAVALNAVMTKFTCSVCFLDHSMKDGITCQKVEQTGEDNELHTFCLECIKEFAARDETALAHGGRGLSCMEKDCQHALMLNKIKSHLPKDVVKRLEERVMDENIGHAEIEGLQRCQKCNLAYEVIGGRYFICTCGNKQCINCGNTFDNKHTERTCQKKKNKAEQTLDDQINDVVVRNCHKCNLQFVKSSGCNFMRCRCGATQCYICREKNITNDHFCKCPGLQEECVCTKRCRQFADANHIDAHRIELLKNSMKSGKKIENQEILKSMPKQAIPDYEDSDDDDDDDGDFADDDDLSDDFDSDDEVPGALLGVRLRGANVNQRIFTTAIIMDSDEDEIPARFARAIPTARSAPLSPIFSSEDEGGANNETIVLDSDGEEENATTAAENPSSEEENDSDDMSESATQVSTFAMPIPDSEEDDSDDSDFHMPDNSNTRPIPVPSTVKRPPSSSSSENTSEDEILVRNLRAPPPPPRQQSLLSNLPRPLPRLPRPVLPSTDDSSEEEGPSRVVSKKPPPSRVLTESLLSSDDSIQAKPGGSSSITAKKLPSHLLKEPPSSEDSSDDENYGIVAAPKSESSSEEESIMYTSDDEIGAIANVHSKIALESSSSDEAVLDSSDEEMIYTSAEEEW